MTVKKKKKKLKRERERELWVASRRTFLSVSGGQTQSLFPDQDSARALMNEFISSDPKTGCMWATYAASGAAMNYRASRNLDLT